MKWQNKIQKFMYGRYGIDELYHFLFVLYIIVLIINLFFQNTWFMIIELVIVFIMFFRVFSKKIYKRSNENQLYLKIKRKLFKPFKEFKRNIKDKNHVYKKCSKCKTILKLPLPSTWGIKRAKCPKCKKILTFITFKKLKIEIIKNKKNR